MNRKRSRVAPFAQQLLECYSKAGQRRSEGLIDAADPSTEEEFAELQRNICQKLRSLSAKDGFENFMKGLLCSLCRHVGVGRFGELLQWIVDPYPNYSYYRIRKTEPDWVPDFTMIANQAFGIDSANPSTLEEFEDLRNSIMQKMLSLYNKKYFTHFLKALTQYIYIGMNIRLNIWMD